MGTSSRGPAVLDDVPTAPGRLPALGHLVPLATRPLQFVTSQRRHGPAVRLFFGRRPVYLVTDHAMIRQLLVEHGSDTDKGSIFEQGMAFLGEGMVTSAGELHKRQRRMVQPAFQHSRIESYVRRMSRQVSGVTDAWRAGQPVELDDLMLRLAFRVITSTAVSVPVPGDVEERMLHNLPLLVRGAITRAILPPLVARAIAPLTRRYSRAANDTRAIVEEVLAVCDAAPDREPDVVSFMRDARDSATGAGMSRKQLADELISIMSAGTETTGGALAWAFYDLATHPEVERGVHEELRRVVGDRPVEWADIPKLEYLARVLNETLRLRSTWLSTRRALRAFRLGDLTVPAGTEMAFSLYAMFRDPTLFPEPDRYRVDRWLPSEAAALPRGAFIPFLDGNRKCLGDSFAWTELVLTVATIAARWRLRLAPGLRVRDVAVATIRPSRLTMIPTPRTVWDQE